VNVSPLFHPVAGLTMTDRTRAVLKESLNSSGTMNRLIKATSLRFVFAVSR